MHETWGEAVELPFTEGQFFAVFAEYNRAFVFVAGALWIATVAIIAFVTRSPATHSRVLSMFLGLLWLWNAVAYHAWLFTRINPAARVFATMFGAQALLFVWAATKNPITYFSSARWLRAVGTSLVAYALAYPFLNVVSGHPYPAAPTFGVPCPTAILTIGLLMTALDRVPLSLTIVPIAWSFIGGSAAVLLAVPADYALLAAGAALTPVMLVRKIGGVLPSGCSAI